MLTKGSVAEKSIIFEVGFLSCSLFVAQGVHLATCPYTFTTIVGQYAPRLIVEYTLRAPG